MAFLGWLAMTRPSQRNRTRRSRCGSVSANRRRCAPFVQIRTIITNLGGAGDMVVQLAARWRRTDRTTWGASPDEIKATLPGDELVPSPSWEYTHAITINAPPSDVWPWLVQLGQGRGGFYSFDLLENLVGCHIHNSETLLPDFQQLDVGDPVRLHPKSPPLLVANAEPQRCLALIGGDPATGGEAAALWAFHLFETSEGTTRLVERGRYEVGPTRAARLVMGPAILEPISFVMSRQMLRNIKRLAERALVDPVI